MKKGKQERYVKDDKELDRYLLQLAVEGASLYLSDAAPPLSDLALENLARQYMTILTIFNRLEQHLAPEILQELINLPALDEKSLSDTRAMDQWGKRLIDRLNENAGASVSYEASVESDENSNQFGLRITRKQHGMRSYNDFSPEFFNGADYRAIKKFRTEIIVAAYAKCESWSKEAMCISLNLHFTR